MTATPNRRFLIATLTVISVAGLTWITVWRFSLASDDAAAAIHIDRAEADEQTPTMASERAFGPEPPVPRSRPTPEQLRPDYVVRMGIDRWPGWAPLVYANGGFKAGKTWTTAAPKFRTFMVELVVIDSPTQMRAELAADTIQIGSATVDMLPFMLDELHKVRASMPRVMQQVDWSNGGDGIVVRKDIESINDLVHHTVVVVEHSPSHFLVLAALLRAGLRPNDLELRFAHSASEAIQTFDHDKMIAACALRAPDLYALAGRDGNKLLITTQTANKLIADVWFARADFVSSNPGVLKSLGRGIIDAMAALDDDAARRKVASWIADRTAAPVGDVLRTLGDVHWTNYAANKTFLLDADSGASAEHLYDVAATALAHGGDEPLPFARISDFTVVRGLAGQGGYAEQTDHYPTNEPPLSLVHVTGPQSDGGAVVARKLSVGFAPNSYEPYFETKHGRYDPDLDRTIQDIARITAEYGSAARIVVEGHSDSSYRGWVDEQRELTLSNDRANAVKKLLIDRLPSVHADQITTAGVGASRPASLGDPDNQARNRRVEITLYRADAR